MLDKMPGEWTDRGACRFVADRSIFFPEPNTKADAAKAICKACPVQRQCLEWALAHGEVGIWGGTSWRQRQRIRAKRNVRLRPSCGTALGWRCHTDNDEPFCAICQQSRDAYMAELVTEPTAGDQRCANPDCDRWFTFRIGPGNPRLYCTPNCRKKMVRRRLSA